MAAVEGAKTRIRAAIESGQDIEARIDAAMADLGPDQRRTVFDWLLAAGADLAEFLAHSDPELPFKLAAFANPGETVADIWERLPEALRFQYTAHINRLDPSPLRVLPDGSEPMAPATYGELKALAFDLSMLQPDLARVRARLVDLLGAVRALPACDARSATEDALLDALSRVASGPPEYRAFEATQTVYMALWHYPAREASRG